MKIATRLYAGFATLLIMMLAITVFGVIQVVQADRTLTNVNQQDSVEQRQAINFRGSVHDRAIAIRDTVMVADSAAAQSHIQHIAELDAFYQASAQELALLYRNGAPTEQERRLLSNIERIEARTVQLTEQTIAMVNRGEYQQAQQFVMAQVSPAYTAWLDSINAMIDQQEVLIQEQLNDVIDQTTGFAAAMLTITLLAIIVGIFIAYRIIQGLARTIGGEPEEAAELINRIAAGDLTVKVRTRHAGSIMAAVGALAKDLSLMIKETMSASNDLAAASVQLAQTAARNEQLIAQQQSETDQGAAAIHQMSQTVQEVASHTVEASHVAGNAQTEFQTGEAEVLRSQNSINSLADEVRGTAEVIDRLSQESREIGTVIEVIQGIAEQTNLLALNAAIEAARAGEHGRGFAVVADEVRGLATRTKDSTRQINDMIGRVQSGAAEAVNVMQRGQQQASDSVEQARRAGDSLQVINKSVSMLNDMNAQIATAAEEQSTVAEEISQNFIRITDAVSNSSNGAKEVSEASRDLESLARSLQSNVTKFKVTG